MRLLWHSGFYDGPLSGMCEENGEKLWFRCIDENDEGRTFEILRLTPESLKHQVDDHALFQKYVGHHTDYGADGKRDYNLMRPSSEHSGYYDNPCALKGDGTIYGKVIKTVSENELRGKA